MKAATVLLSLLPLLSAASPVLVDSIHNEAAPVLQAMNGETIPDKYIIVFKKHVKHGDASAHHDWVHSLHVKTEGAKLELRKRDVQVPFQNEIFDGLKHTFNIAGNLLGYTGHFDEDVIEQVRRHPDVSHSINSLPQACLHSRVSPRSKTYYHKLRQLGSCLHRTPELR
jgi:cerevisin